MDNLKYLISFLILTSTGSYAQEVPTLTVDSTQRTSEYLEGTYSIPYGVGGATWTLTKFGKLEFGYNISDSPPRSWNKPVGTWTLVNSLIEFQIELSNLPKKHREKLPKQREYESLVIKKQWNSSEFSVENTSNDQVELHLIILADKSERSNIINDYLSYVDTRYREQLIEFGKDINNLTVSDEVDTLIRLTRDFCDRSVTTRELPFNSKVYINGTLFPW
tara:strand:+ start:287 stop:946 length:660 start_codon:yes stop_codon:yes gene_type:complete